MPQQQRRSFGIAFVGMPDDFRRAHRTELADLSAEAVWLASTDALAKIPPPMVLVLNLDDEANGLSAEWEALRSVFPQTEMIAVSSQDSARLAMRCLRAGFSDFLTQPVASDDLALCLLRCRQRWEAASKSVFPHGDISRALTQISSGTGPTLRLRTLGFLQSLLGSTHGLWYVGDNGRPKVLAAIPAVVDKKNPRDLFQLGLERRKVFRSNKGLRRVVLRCRRQTNGKLLFWGIHGRLTRRKIDQAAAIIEHAELTLLNLRRVEKLKRQTYVDDLTGLYNSRYLKFALEAAAVHTLKRGDPFAVLFVDVDRFKSVNDRHGHLVGSAFLEALGRIIKNAVRRGDLVFRYGGDEFVILLRNAESSRALEIAERLRQQTANRQVLIQDIRLQATVSIGLAACPEHAKETQTLIRLADEAMYLAKRKRNAVEVAKVPAPGEKRPSRRRQHPIETAL